MNKNKFDNLLFLLPLFYILYIFYIRLFVTRPPKNILENMPIELLFPTLLTTFIMGLRLYFILKREGIIKKKEEKPKWLLLILPYLNTISEWISNLWINFFNFLLAKIFKLNFILLYISKKLRSYEPNWKGYCVIILLNLLPRIILITLFIIELFFYKKFNYFYKGLFLLLLPLAWTVIEKMLEQFFYSRYEILKFNLIEIDISNDPDPLIKTYDYSFKPDYILPPFAKDLEDYVTNLYTPVRNIPYILSRFKEIKQSLYINYIDILLAGIYLIGWVYIVYYGYIK